MLCGSLPVCLSAYLLACLPACLQAGCQAEVERLSGQLQEAIVAAEVGRAKVLLYDELTSKTEKLVSRLVTGPLHVNGVNHAPGSVHAALKRGYV